MTSSSDNDHLLMERIAEGDAQAFRQLSDQHLRPILVYASRLLKNQAEAEEVAQETFLRAWQKAGSYSPNARVSTWLHRIAHNLCIDRLRRQSRKNETAETNDDLDAAPASDRPSRLLERKCTAEQVARALDELPSRQREAIVLCHEQGLSNPEIAEVLGTGVEAVESLLARGRRKLRSLLQP